MANLTGVLAESIIELTKNPHQGQQNDARAYICAALAANSQLAIRTIQAIVSSGIHSPESVAELLFEFIDPVVVNGLIATPYDPADTESISALASLLSSVSPDKRTVPFSFSHPLSSSPSPLLFRLAPFNPPSFFFSPSLFARHRSVHRKGRMHCER
jgi:hypothetical protein